MKLTLSFILKGSLQQGEFYFQARTLHGKISGLPKTVSQTLICLYIIRGSCLKCRFWWVDQRWGLSMYFSQAPRWEQCFPLSATLWVGRTRTPCADVLGQYFGTTICYFVCLLSYSFQPVFKCFSSDNRHQWNSSQL